MLAGGECAARVGHPRDGTRHRPREEQRDDRREHGAHEAGESEAEHERRPVGGGARRGAEEHDRLVPVPPGRVEEPLAADVDAAARTRPSADPVRSFVGQEELRLRGGEDREPLLVRRKESAQLVAGARLELFAPLRGDELDLSLERAHRRPLERPSREQRARHDGDHERHEHGSRDADEEARP